MPDKSIKPLDAATAAFYLAPTELIPTDGIVRQTARDVTKGKLGDIDKARAIYEWIVDNTARDPKTRGCGIGDVKSMLESGNLKGKCADLSAGDHVKVRGRLRPNGVVDADQIELKK